MFFRWAKKQDFMNRWMPEPWDVFTVHLGEFFWSETYKSSQENGWTRDYGKRCPTDVLVTCHDYVCESSGFDCSLDESVRIGLPTKSLVDGMGVKWTGVEGQLEDGNGRVTVFDPSVFESGPQSVLVRADALRDYLSKNELDIVWTLLGEKQMIGGDHHDRDNHPGWLQISGAYKLASNGIVGSYSTKRVPANRS